MVTETGLPRAKKRRPAAIHSLQPAKTDAVNPEPAGAGGDGGSSSQQQPAPTGSGGGGGGIDRIGFLPDGVLGDIISLLPTRDGTRSQIVARGWRPLWRSAPLNLDLRDLPTDDIDALCRGVAGILAAHPGPCRYVRIPSCCVWHKRDAVGTWLQSPTLDNLEELHLCLCHQGWAHWPSVLHLQPPPPPTLRFCPSLRVLTLSTCEITDDIGETLHFPELQKLALEKVGISEGSLNRVIAAGCPKLECLLLCQSMGFSCIKRCSATLRNVAVVCHNVDMVALSEIIVQDAPCLEKLLFRDHVHHPGLRVSVIAAPKLQTFGCLKDRNGVQRIKIGSNIIQGLRVIDSKTRVCSVKTMAITFHALKLDTVIDLMRCFPCLENLYLKIRSSNDDNLWCRKYRVLLKSLDIHLKKLVLLGYKGTESYVNFATFFVMNGRRLETVRFVGDANMENELFIAKQHKLLQLEKRASIGAQFYFKTGKCNYHHAHINNVHDLSTADPFECKC